MNIQVTSNIELAWRGYDEYYFDEKLDLLQKLMFAITTWRF